MTKNSIAAVGLVMSAIILLLMVLAFGVIMPDCKRNGAFEKARATLRKDKNIAIVSANRYMCSSTSTTDTYVCDAEETFYDETKKVLLKRDVKVEVVLQDLNNPTIRVWTRREEQQ